MIAEFVKAIAKFTSGLGIVTFGKFVGRLRACHPCQFRGRLTCLKWDCGCPIATKALLESTKCLHPLGSRWESLAEPLGVDGDVQPVRTEQGGSDEQHEPDTRGQCEPDVLPKQV